VAIGRRLRFRNPRGGGSGGSAVGKVLPWLAIGGLLYLMAQNSAKVKAAGGTTTTSAAPSAGSVGNNAGCNDFGVTGCWTCG
jgi:hypothetical protein